MIKLNKNLTIVLILLILFREKIIKYNHRIFNRKKIKNNKKKLNIKIKLQARIYKI